MVKIRMSRLGRPHRPFYRIAAVDSRVKRDGIVIENLGWLDPLAKGAEKPHDLKVERIKHWLSVGAQPSETITDLLIRHNIMDGTARKQEIVERIAAKKKVAERTAATTAAAAAKKEAAAAAAAEPKKEG